jgi:hypothetical protein
MVPSVARLPRVLVRLVGCCALLLHICVACRTRLGRLLPEDPVEGAQGPRHRAYAVEPAGARTSGHVTTVPVVRNVVKYRVRAWLPVGLEPTTSSSRIRFGPLADLASRLFALVMALVVVGLTRGPKRAFSRSAPISLPDRLAVGRSCPVGFPVAQACPDWAAPTGSRWSATLAERPGPGRRGLVAFGASPAGRRPGFPQRRGPGRVALAAGGQFRVVGPVAARGRTW